MIINDKGFFLDKTETIKIWESINEIYNERSGDHYMVLSEISGGDMRRVTLSELLSNYNALTPAMLMGNKKLLNYYVDMLKDGVEFELFSADKTNQVRDKLEKKYGLNKKMGFGK